MSPPAGLQLDPANDQLKQGLQDAKAAAARASSGPAGPGLFASPEVLSRLASNPQTRALLGQPDFMAMLSNVNSNPESMQRYLADDRFQLALQVGLGLSVRGGGDEGGEAEGGSGAEPMQHDAQQQREQQQQRQQPAAAAAPQPEPEPEPEADLTGEEWELLNK